METFALLVLAAAIVLHALILKGTRMAALDDLISALKAQVDSDTTVHGSVKTFIGNLQSQLAAALAAATSAGATADQLSALQNVLDTLKANDDDLAGAVTANTPVENPS